MSDFKKQFIEGMSLFAAGVRHESVELQERGLSVATEALSNISALAGTLSPGNYDEFVEGLAGGMHEIVSPLEKRLAAIEAKLGITGGSNGR